MTTAAGYEVLIVSIIEKIKLLNEQPLPSELSSGSLLYADGANLDSKDMMELLIYLENETGLALLESNEYSPEALVSVGSLATAFERLYQATRP